MNYFNLFSHITLSIHLAILGCFQLAHTTVSCGVQEQMQYCNQDLTMLRNSKYSIPFHIGTNMMSEFLNRDYVGIHFSSHIIF